MSASYAISVRQASGLLSASFRFHLAVNTLAVQLVIPLTGLTEDSHLQVILPAPPVQEQRPSRRYAPCPAHQKKAAHFFKCTAFYLQVSPCRLGLTANSCCDCCCGWWLYRRGDSAAIVVIIVIVVAIINDWR